MAALRDELAPEPNTAGAKATTCEKCGGEFWQWQRKYAKRCSRCAAIASDTAVNATTHKQGPAYEKVVRGSLRFWLAEAERLGLTPDAT